MEGNVNKQNICGINQNFHVAFSVPIRPLLLSPVYWPLTHPWARAPTLHPTPGSAPLTWAAARHTWGAWRLPITNSSGQGTGLPHTHTCISPPQKQTPCSHPRQVFFCTPQLHKMHFLLFFSSFFYLKWGEKKWRKWRVPFFLHFSILSHLSFSCSPRVCVCVCVSPPWLNVSLSVREMDARVPFSLLRRHVSPLPSAGLVCTCILWYSASVQPVDCL